MGEDQYQVLDGIRFETIEEARAHLLKVEAKKIWQDTLKLDGGKELDLDPAIIFIKINAQNINDILEELEIYESAGDQWPVA